MIPPEPFQYSRHAAILVGTRFSKAQQIENLKSVALKYASYDVSERLIQGYGDTVVEGGRNRK
jgi:hypothetical protein